MYINLANIDFGGESGGSPAVLQETTIETLLTETEKVVTPPEGVDGFNKVTVTHAPVETLTEATITQNGEVTITPSEGYDATLGVKAVVNVEGKLKVQDGWSFAYSDDIASLIEKIDTSEVTSGRNYNSIGMFSNCAPTDYSSLDLSNVNKAYGMFAYPNYSVGNDEYKVPLYKMTNCIDFSYICSNTGGVDGGLSGFVMFPSNLSYDRIAMTGALEDNYKVKQVAINFPNAEIEMSDFLYMSFYDENNHYSDFLGIRDMQVGKIISFNNAFRGCTKMTLLTAEQGYFDVSEMTQAGSSVVNPFFKCVSLTTLSGFRGLSVDFVLSDCNALTHDSLLNVINEAADVTASPKTLTFGSTNLAKLTDEEKAIATNKGWALA